MATILNLGIVVDEGQQLIDFEFPALWKGRCGAVQWCGCYLESQASNSFLANEPASGATPTSSPAYPW
jgi:hypothetical protein